jgi:hypothetical protein
LIKTFGGNMGVNLTLYYYSTRWCHFVSSASGGIFMVRASIRLDTIFKLKHCFIDLPLRAGLTVVRATKGKILF